jgi:hypothetical protein
MVDCITLLRGCSKGVQQARQVRWMVTGGLIDACTGGGGREGEAGGREEHPRDDASKCLIDRQSIKSSISSLASLAIERDRTINQLSVSLSI